MKHRNIIFYKAYFQDFFEKQRPKVQEKIIWTLELIEDLQRVPETYLKHLENTKGLYEIRVQSGNDIFRIFCFSIRENLLFWPMGFTKNPRKPQKTK